MMYLKKCSQATLKQLDNPSCVTETKPVYPIMDPLSSTLHFASSSQTCALMKHVFVRQCRSFYNNTEDNSACKGIKGFFTMFASSKPCSNDKPTFDKTKSSCNLSCFPWKFFLLSLVSLFFLSLFYVSNSVEMNNIGFVAYLQHVSYQLVLLLERSLLLFFTMYERFQPLVRDYTKLIYSGYQSIFKAAHDFITSKVTVYLS
jgi:hypothetical protein